MWVEDAMAACGVRPDARLVVAASQIVQLSGSAEAGAALARMLERLPPSLRSPEAVLAAACAERAVGGNETTLDALVGMMRGPGRSLTPGAEAFRAAMRGCRKPELVLWLHGVMEDVAQELHQPLKVPPTSLAPRSRTA